MNYLRPAILGLLTLAALGAVVVAAQTSPNASAVPGGKIYWSTNTTIQRANLDEQRGSSPIRVCRG